MSPSNPEDCLVESEPVGQGYLHNFQDSPEHFLSEENNNNIDDLSGDEDVDAEMSESESGFMCILCNKQYLYQQDMVQHELKAHFAWAVKPYNLALLYTLIRIIRVDSKVDNSVELRVELETALDDFEKVYDRDVRCIECEYSSRNRDDLIGHYKSIHIHYEVEDDNAGEMDFEAASTEKDTFDVRRGEKAVDNVPTKELMPNAKSRPQTSLKKTAQSKAEPGRNAKTPLFECGFCKKLFPGSRKFQRHVMAQHFPDLRCHLCDFRPPATKSCDKNRMLHSAAQSFSRHMMRTHKMTLSGNAGFPCPSCDFIALSSQYLEHHRRIKHTEKKEDPSKPKILAQGSDCTYRCKICEDVSFSSKAELKRHLRNGLSHIDLCQTCGLPVPNRERTANVHECPAQLGSRKFLQQNEFGHQSFADGGETCQLCGYHCSSQVIMLRHQALMHLEQSCPYLSCGHVAKDRLELRAHIRSKHEDMCHMCTFMTSKGSSHNCAEEILLPSKDKPQQINPMVADISSDARLCGCRWCLTVISSSLNLHGHLRKCSKAPKGASVGQETTAGRQTGNTTLVYRHLSQYQYMYNTSLCQTCGLPLLEKREGSQHQCPAQFGPRMSKPFEEFKCGRLESGDSICYLCGFTCKTDLTMMRHKSLMHKPQKCPSKNCVGLAPNRPELRTHIRSQHPEMCDTCAFVSKQEGDTHKCAEYLLLPQEEGNQFSKNAMITQIQPFNNQPGACPRCFQVFNKKNNLYYHMANACKVRKLN